MDDKFIEYVDQRLDQWATWYSSGNSYGLGYPQRSMEHVLMTEGVVSKAATPKYLPCNEEAEEIEALVVEMAKQNKKMAFILRYYYFEPGALRAKAENFSADHSSISWKKFKDYVDMARQWMAGRLSAL
jgi:hypothetical protein